MSTSRFGKGKRGIHVNSSTKQSGIFLFEIQKFCDTLHLFPASSNIKKWLLKKDWVEFSKKYFSSARPMMRHVKGAYDFFRRNEKEIMSLMKRSPTSNGAVGTRDNLQNDRRTEEESKSNYSISFPNLTKIKNSVLVVNSDHANVSPLPLGSNIDKHSQQHHEKSQLYRPQLVMLNRLWRNFVLLWV